MNKVVPKSDVMKTALEWAKEVTQNSPDSIQSTKRALVLSNQLGDVEDAVIAHHRSKEMLRVYASDNIKVSLTMPWTVSVAHVQVERPAGVRTGLSDSISQFSFTDPTISHRNASRRGAILRSYDHLSLPTLYNFSL